MKRQKFIFREKPKAAMRAGTLILSLPNAVDPVVWRLDMRQVATSALEIRPSSRKMEGASKDAAESLEERGREEEQRTSSPEDALYDLVLKSRKADLHTIASFYGKEEALRALKTVMRTLEEVPTPFSYATVPPALTGGAAFNDDKSFLQRSNIKPGATTQASSQEVQAGSGLSVSDTISSRGRPVLAGVLGALVIMLLLFIVLLARNPGPASLSGVSSLPGGAGHEVGVPMAADEFLKNL